MAIWYDTGPYQVVLPPLLRVPLPPVLLRFGGGYSHFTVCVCVCVCVCAFLTSAEVASTEYLAAYSLGCPGYLCRYKLFFFLFFFFNLLIFN